MSSIDKDELKSHLNEYLSSIGIDTRKLFCCLNPSHKDSTPSMKYFDDGRVYCFGCGATYDLIDTIAAYENIDRKEAYKKAIKYYGRENSTEKLQIKNKSKINDIEEKHEEKNYEKAFKFWEMNLEKTKEAKDYLFSRGLDEKVIKQYHIGFNSFDFKKCILNAVIIPINKNCFTARNIDNENKFRYYKTKGEHSDLFNKSAMCNDYKYCVITEGEFDALSFLTLGINATALGSVSNFQKFIDAEKSKDKVFILSLDNDNAGMTTLEKFEEYFNNNNIKYKIFDNLGYKDANLALITERDILDQKIKKIVKDIENQDEMN